MNHFERRGFTFDVVAKKVLKAADGYAKIDQGSLRRFQLSDVRNNLLKTVAI